jgi:asparagine synthase (glutamine-hydrolysing)
MCGLTAVVSRREALPVSVITSMSTLITHRGPDDHGVVAFCGSQFSPAVQVGRGSAPTSHCRAALALRRLAILDLSERGHQPMSNAAHDVWVAYNGEIYNFIEVRAELAARGHAFATQSDTEVLLAAYQEWGTQCLERLRGMFALVLFDLRRGLVWAARDRFGIKPLYYTVTDEAVAFASEVKQFTALPGFAAHLSRQRAYDYLAAGLTDHTDETLWQGVYQLRGGESLTLALDGTGFPRKTHWYRPQPRPFAGDFDAAATGFREHFSAAVSEHLRSDVPVGSCLSGGLDSSAIVAMTRRLLGSSASQHTFSARSTDAALDEGKYIEAAAKASNAIAHEVTPDAARLFDDLDRLLWHQDEPFGSTSIFAQWSVFQQAAAQGLKVMLDGQGADEQLAGYRAFVDVGHADLLRQGRLLELGTSLLSSPRALARSAMGLADETLPETLRQVARRAGSRATSAPDWLDVERLGAAGDAAAAPRPRSLAELSLAQLTRTHLPMLLRWEDRNSMAHSIEARVPFLDHRLVEFALGLPDEFKLHRQTSKRVMRAAMRGIVPDAILARRDKIGFATPEEQWMRAHAPRFRAALAESVDAARGIVRPQALEHFDAFVARRRRFDAVPWRVLCFGRWLGRFNVSAV